MFKIIVLVSFLVIVGCTTHSQLGNKSPVSTEVVYINKASSPVRVIFALKELNGRSYEVIGSISASGNYRKTNDALLMEALKRQVVNMGANVLLFGGFSNDLPPSSNTGGGGWEDVGASIERLGNTLMAKAYAVGYALKVK